MSVLLQYLLAELHDAPEQAVLLLGSREDGHKGVPRRQPRAVLLAEAIGSRGSSHPPHRSGGRQGGVLSVVNF